MKKNINEVVKDALDVAKENINDISNVDLIKWNYLKSITIQTNEIKDKIIDTSKYLEKMTSVKLYRTQLLTTIASLPFITDIDITKIKTKNLVMLSVYLDEIYYPTVYMDIAKILGNDDLIDVVLEKTKDIMIQCSLLSLIVGKSYDMQLDINDQEKVKKFQTESISYLKNTDLDDLIAKSNYIETMQNINETLDKIM